MGGTVKSGLPGLPPQCAPKSTIARFPVEYTYIWHTLTGLQQPLRFTNTRQTLKGSFATFLESEIRTVEPGVVWLLPDGTIGPCYGVNTSRSTLGLILAEY